MPLCSRCHRDRDCGCAVQLLLLRGLGRSGAHTLLLLGARRLIHSGNSHNGGQRGQSVSASVRGSSRIRHDPTATPPRSAGILSLQAGTGAGSSFSPSPQSTGRSSAIKPAAARWMMFWPKSPLPLGPGSGYDGRLSRRRLSRAGSFTLP